MAVSGCGIINPILLRHGKQRIRIFRVNRRTVHAVTGSGDRMQTYAIVIATLFIGLGALAALLPF
jgi:hypothetical protein